MITLCIIGAIFLIGGGLFVWNNYLREKPIVALDIPTSRGWMGTRDGNRNYFAEQPVPRDQFNSAQIIVYAKRMDRSPEEWVRGYIDNNPAFEHIPFDPLQTWSSVNGHLILVTERKPTSFLTFHLFGKGVVYEFWFAPFGRSNEQQQFVYNTKDLEVVQAMIADFAAKL